MIITLPSFIRTKEKEKILHLLNMCISWISTNAMLKHLLGLTALVDGFWYQIFCLKLRETPQWHLEAQFRSWRLMFVWWFLDKSYKLAGGGVSTCRQCPSFYYLLLHPMHRWNIKQIPIGFETGILQLCFKQGIWNSWPPRWSRSQQFWLLITRSRVWFPAFPHIWNMN